MRWLSDKSALRTIFGADLRSLALMRICVALLSIWDLLHHVQDLTAHYTDLGVYPRSRLIEEEVAHGFPWWSMTFHSLSGRWEAQAFLFFIHGLFALGLLVGYRTRWMTFLTWLFTASLQARNPVILQAGDLLHRVILFWGIFLPWGEVASVDRYFKRKTDEPTEYADLWVSSPAVAAYLLQFAFLYFFSALQKYAPEWRVENTGVYYALNVEQFTTSFGLILLDMQWLMKPLCYFVYRLELYGPLLLFCPVGTAWLRLGVIAGLFLMQMGFWISMALGSFPFMSVIASLGALPALFWDQLPRSVCAFVKGKGDQLASRLHWLPQGGEPFVVSPRWRVWQAGLRDALVLFLIFYVFLWNLGTLPNRRIEWLNANRWIGNVVRLDQVWDMFAPYPLKEDGWYVIPAKLKNGKEVDLFRDGAAVDWTRPALISETYANFRWRKYMMNLWLKKFHELRPYYAAYLCRTWNATHPAEEQVTELEIYFMLKLTQPDYKAPEMKKVLLGAHRCRGNFYR